MRFLKGCTTSLGVALLGLAFSSPVEADAWNRKTTITFSQPIEVPGVQPTGWGVLPAGTYVFKIMDSQANRHIVQIFDEDEKVVYATILAIPNYRLKATDKTVITFSERPAGQPEALRAWFYPGLNWGEEFVYPKEKAIELAKQTNQPVLFTPIAIKAAATEPIVSGTEPQVAELEQAPVKAVRPTGEEVELAQAVSPPPVAIAQARVPSYTPPQMAEKFVEALPETAGLAPLAGLLGVLAFGGAFALRVVRNRIS